LTLSPASTRVRRRVAARPFVECVLLVYLHDKPARLPASYATPLIGTGLTSSQRI
jgi:hypothetical protein